MSFGLQVDVDGGDRDEFISSGNRAMAALLDLLVPVADPDHSTLLSRLGLNDGALVEQADCRWLAAYLRAVDRDVIARELLGLIDQFVASCDRCVALGGFEVW